MRCLLVLAAFILVMCNSMVTAWKPECDCPEEQNPVCARNDRTYPNPCTLKCANQLKAYDGPCIRKGTVERRQQRPL